MKNIILHIALIVLLGFGIYANSLHSQFIYDDVTLIKYNNYIKSWSNLPKVLVEDIGGGIGVLSSFNRQIQMISYMIDYSLWGLNTMGYHITNIILHIFVSLCIYWMINTLHNNDNKMPVALLVSLFYLTHPIHTETVAYISGRADSLAAIFILLCIIFYIKQVSSESTPKFILILLSYLFSLFSKEYSLITPVLLFLYSRIFKKSLRTKEFFSVIVITAIYLTSRIVILKHSSSTVISTTFFQRLPGFFVAIAGYFRLLLLPFNLHMAYGNTIFSLNDPRAILGITILLTLLLYSFIKLNSNRLASFSICWFFITLLPQSNLLYPINAFMAEHWLYLPSLGFFLILTKSLISLYEIRKIKNIALVLIVCILFFYSYLTIKQNNYWKEPISFYKRTLKYAPGNWELYYNLGLNYANRGNNKDAIASYRKVLEINPKDINTYCNLSAIYCILGKNEEASALLKKAIEINPDDARLYYLLGNLYGNISEEKEAMAAYKKSININPNYVLSYNGLGNIYIKKGNKEEAVRLFSKAITLLKEAIRLDPDLALARNNLAEAYYYTNQYDLAIKHCDRAIELGYEVAPKFLELLKPYRK